MKCSTVNININGVKVVINESDFDPDTMELWSVAVNFSGVAPIPPSVPVVPPAPASSVNARTESYVTHGTE